MENYRECMEACLQKGERMPYSHKQYNREAVLVQLEQLIANKESEAEAGIVRGRAENCVPDFLWILADGEVQEKGFYSWNKPDTELAVVATPALLAFLMGEYDLSIAFCEAGLCQERNEVALELKQVGQKSYLGGGTIRFCEVCLLCPDMTKEQISYFAQNDFLDGSNLWKEKGEQFSEICFFVDMQVVWEHLYGILQKIREDGEVYGDAEDILVLILWYALRQVMDRGDPKFWHRIYSLFADTKFLSAIPYTLHAYARAYYAGLQGSFNAQYRLLAGMNMYFRFADAVDIRCVELYIEEILLSKRGMGRGTKKYRQAYFDVMEKIKGDITEGWLEQMVKLLNIGDYVLIETAFQCGYLREDCVEYYISYFLTNGKCAGLIPYLVRRRWNEKEDANGSV